MLKSLELFGFKSFADKTVFEFHEGITGVVGPNGSGKSNVVDSIKWLLGDQSAKSLRGKEMTDVIFNGSTSRGGAQFAEATLTFDNTTRFLPVEHDQVSVGRRLWKSGDSEYLINGTVSRLKDVRELLMGTGAGTASYCIIEQGRVDQILQSNAANRRLIFEEAAGISRFKQRKNEAERRLERVEQNLLRLTDIVDEVGSQVRKIRSQAKRAMEYREVSTELEQLWVGAVADDFRRQSMVRERLNKQQQEASALLEQTRERQQLAEAQLAEVDSALSAVDDELREAEHSRADLRSRIASLETTLRHHAARESELHGESQRLQRQRAVMDGRVAEAEKEEEHLANVLVLEQKRFDERREQQESDALQLKNLQHSLTEAEQAIEVIRRQAAELNGRLGELTTESSRLQHEVQSLQQRRKELLQTRTVQQQEIVDLEEQTQRQQTRVRDAQERVRLAEEAADEILGNRDALVDQQAESRETLADLREQRSAAMARRTVLEDLEDRQEGFGIGARDILRRAEDGDTEPWNLIRGSVADLLDVDMENAALLEVALSGRAQMLVIDRLQPLVNYINSGRCQITGRVGFVSLESADQVEPRQPAGETIPAPDPNSDEDSDAASWQGDLGLGMFGDDWLNNGLGDSLGDEFLPQLNVTWLDENGEIPVVRSVFSGSTTNVISLVGRPGVVGRADSLARSPRHIPSLAAQLLADTWVVQSLDDGLRLQQELGSDYRFVTLQGELVEKDGTLHTGTVRSESAVVSRKSELRRLKNELHRIEHLISERDLRLKKLVESIEMADTELQGSRDNVERFASELRTDQQQLAEIRQALTSANRNLETLNDQIQQLEGNIQQLDEQLQQIEVSRTEAKDERDELQQQVQDAERSLLEDRTQMQLLEKNSTDGRLELTRSEERLLGIRDAVQRLADDLQQRRLQQREATRRLTVGVERLNELNLSRLNVAAEISELQVYDDQLTIEILRRSDARGVLRARRKAATDAEQQAREICRQHEKQFHEVELKISGIDHQLETAAERIQDEYQMTVEDAVQAGRSAVVSWLNLQQIGSPDTDFDASESANSEPSDFADEDVEQVEIDDPQVQQILRDDDRYDALRKEVDGRVSELRKRLKKIGAVGTESLDNLNELEARFERLHSHLMDLEAARDTLRDMVRRINEESRRMFVESFNCVQGHFRQLFRQLFGGGEADVILEDPEDVLDCAIDVVARPPGKELRSISLLSGGEKTMTAVALLLSIFKSRPSPFCILDEVDAALDDANIGRFVGVLKDFREDTQFIMITHRKPTMAVTDVLYGVTMEESGISKRLVVRFEEIDDKGNFIPRDENRSRAA